MTRINSDINVGTLSDQHLMAEWRELSMVPASLKRSLKNNSLQSVISRIPNKFTLGTGHVLFWYNKLDFLKTRYYNLTQELINRRYNIDVTRPHNLDGFPIELYGSYTMDNKDKEIIIERLLSRINIKPDWYKFYGKKYNVEILK